MFAQTQSEGDRSGGDIIAKVREALLMAQLIITQEAIEEYVDE